MTNNVKQRQRKKGGGGGINSKLILVGQVLQQPSEPQ